MTNPFGQAGYDPLSPTHSLGESDYRQSESKPGGGVVPDRPNPQDIKALRAAAGREP